MKKTFLLTVLILGTAFILAGCLKTPINPTNSTDNNANQNTADLGGFCGKSTKVACQTDTDCTSGGCSDQICGSASDDGGVSTCEYTECYDKIKYGVTCGCVSRQCQWYK